MKRVLCLTAALCLLWGCSPNAREPDHLALVRVLGVDGASPVTLTAVCGGQNGQSPLRGSCVGDDFHAAREVLPWAGEEELALTGVSWLIVSGDVDLEGVLFGVLEDRELGAAAAVFLARDGAAALLGACDDPVADLELLRLRGLTVPTAAEALGALLTEGSVLLPVVGAQEGRLLYKGEERWYGVR